MNNELRPVRNIKIKLLKNKFFNNNSVVKYIKNVFLFVIIFINRNEILSSTFRSMNQHITRLRHQMCCFYKI